MAGGAKHTILVVDDEATIRQLAVDELKAHGYQVLSARSGAEALALLRDHDGETHLLLTDVSMPGMSGGELAEVVGAERPRSCRRSWSGRSGRCWRGGRGGRLSRGGVPGYNTTLSGPVAQVVRAHA